jgi:hypothetical protein
MPNKEIPFLTQAAVLEQYAKSDPSSAPELLDLIADALTTNSELRIHFFRVGPDPRWMPVLWERGFLAKPPEPIKTERGYVLSRWEAQEFLIAVAKDVPEIVVEHIRSIKGESVYLERALVALRNIPSQAIEKALPTVIDWLKDPVVGYAIAMESLELMKKLASDGNKAAALQLLRSITKPLPATDRKPDELLRRAEANTILPVDEFYSKFFWKALVPLRELDPRNTALLLAEQLREALRIEAEALNDTNYEKRSFWRNTVEESDQDAFLQYKDVLLVGLRDTLEAWIDADADEAHVKVAEYLQDRFEIFRRLGLHLLQRFPGRFRQLVSAELLKPENIDDVGVHHEYFMLLQEGYAHLDGGNQHKLLQRILSGPTEDKRAEIAEWANKNNADRGEYIENYSKRWTRDRLWMIRDHLSAETKEELQRLLSEIGEVDHPEYTHWISGAFWVSNVSPVTEGELEEKGPEQLVEYLKEWRPSPQTRFGPEQESYGALGQQVGEVILSSLETYQDHLLAIASIRPEYAVGLLKHPSKNQIDATALWNLRLNVCERLLQDEHIRTDMDWSLEEGGWISFRRAAIDTLEKAVTEGEKGFPDEFLPRLRDLLIILVDDPDPSLESDRPKDGWLGHGDPLTVAINHNRSEALYSLIRYSLKIARKDPGQKGFGPQRFERSVKEVMTHKVNKNTEPSFAVHSVFGREFNGLFWLDQAWVVSNIDNIFPPGDDDESIAFYIAAWDSFIVSDARIFAEVFQYLRPKYERAIDNVSKGYVTKSHLRPVEHLANHLVAEYFERDYDIRSIEGQQSLIAKFFNVVGPEARAEAAWALGRKCNQDRDKIDKFWPRAKSLWHWRADVASSAGHSTDFDREMTGFASLLHAAPQVESIVSLWPLLEGLLPYIGRSKTFDRIWHILQEYLAKEVSRDPLRTIRYYRLMHDQLKAPVFYYADEAKVILEAGAANKEAREDTWKLIDKIARSGLTQFNHIFETYAG